MRVLVCGGRTYTDMANVNTVLGRYDITELCHGGAKGADSLAGVYADKRSIPTTVFRADWKQHGLAAGPIRNQRMLTEFKPDLVIAFPGGKGTADMCKRAAAARVPVVVC